MFKMKMFIRKEYNINNISFKKIYIKINKLKMSRANLLRELIFVHLFSLHVYLFQLTCTLSFIIILRI